MNIYDPVDAKFILADHQRKFGINTGASAFVKQEWKKDFRGALDAFPDLLKDPHFAMDAQTPLVSVPNSAIPSFLTTFIDPDILRVLSAPNTAAEILGEERRGSFVDATAVFPVVEYTGETSSYGDFSNNGQARANTNYPTREAYIYQVVIEYGMLEAERQGLAKIGWASDLKLSSISVLNKFQNLTYFYGVSGLANYGLLNDPSLSTSIAAGPKAYNSNTSGPWTTNGFVTATANEIYSDVQALFGKLVAQSQGNITKDSKLVLALSPNAAVALTTTNSFNVNVEDLLKKNFKNLRVVTAVQYGVSSTNNNQGYAAGEVVQLIAEDVEGQKTGFGAYNEKLRAGPIVPGLSSWMQKTSQGSWGVVLKQGFAVATMVGV